MLRFSNVYGDIDDYPDRVIPAFAAARLGDTPLVIAGPDRDGYEPTVRAMIAQHRLEDRGLFTGMLHGRNRLEAYVRTRGFNTPVTDVGATSQWMSMRLDAIYTRGLRVVERGVEDGVRASDHLPLWAEVVLASS